MNTPKMEQLPPGFRFYPTEEELISFYLNNKLHGHGPDLDPVIPSIDIYTFEPSQLPGLAGRLCEGEREQWFFFMAQQEREARGGRPNRTTASGYWKATGSPTYVYSHNNKVIGVKKTMVFYKGKAPTGRKTKWKMNEYKAIINNQEEDILNNNTSFPPSSSTSTIPKLRHEHSLCRVYVTSGCARAFDRRPPAATLLSNTNAHIINAGNNNQRQRSTTGTQERSSSSTDDSSNSGVNDQCTLQDQEAAAAAAGSSNSYDIDMDDQALWDWEQLDWP